MQFRWLSTFQEWHMLRLLTKPFGRIACKFSRLSIYVWKKSFKNGVGSINFICDLKRLFSLPLLLDLQSVSSSINSYQWAIATKIWLGQRRWVLSSAQWKSHFVPVLFYIWHDVESTGWEFTRSHETNNPLLLTEFSQFPNPVHVFFGQVIILYTTCIWLNCRGSYVQMLQWCSMEFKMKITRGQDVKR